MHLRTRSLASLVIGLSVAAGACGGPPASGSLPGSPAPASGAPAASGFTAVVPTTALDAAALDDLEAALARDAVDSAGLAETIGGAEMLDAVEALRRTVAADAVTELLGDPGTATRHGDTLVGQVAAAGAVRPPTTALSGLDFSGSLAMTAVFTNQVLTRNPPSSEGSNSSSTSRDTSRVTAGGRTADVTVESTLSIVRNGSTITGAADVTTTISVLDSAGNVAETITTTSHGVVEIDTCPAADGSVNADYLLDYEVSSSSGASAEYHVSGRVIGQVLDDAYLHGFRVEASASTRNNAGVDRAVAIQGAASMTGAAGNVTALQVTQDAGQIIRADPDATMGDMTELGRLAVSPGFMLIGLLFDTAQAQWRSGACVEVESLPGSRDVKPNEQLQLIVDVKHKIEGRVLRGLPVKGTQTGARSLSPEDVDVSTPHGFTYVATGHLGDVGKVHFISTSRRGIGTLDVEFTVATELVVELVIDSTFNFTKYNNLPTDAKAHVEGTIRLERNAATGLWSGRGHLNSTTTTGMSGCNSITISGAGNRYDWVVREVKAEPGMPDSDLEVWMDAGPTPESFDAFTARYCPGPTLTGTVNTWENIFFLLEMEPYYGVKGLHVTGFDAQGANTAEWRDGLVLGRIGWFADCKDMPAVAAPSGLPQPADLSEFTQCTGTTTYTLRVVDPGP